jgi:hypothetical protein
MLVRVGRPSCPATTAAELVCQIRNAVLLVDGRLIPEHRNGDRPRSERPSDYNYPYLVRYKALRALFVD